MSTSLFLAQIGGIYMLVGGVAMLVRQKELRGLIDELVQNKALTLYGGFIALIVGLLIVLNHNVWAASWEVIITVFGWVAVVKGLVLILFPAQKTLRFYKKLITPAFINVVAIIWLALGLYLAYIGFYA